ncbi:hypothetical protein MXB02_14220 [Pseudomonas mosselii]|uniref:hypothetical protein n=1 Tax=Pseudomonas mosselii TaxID=78327 RepID=UPI001FF7F4DB|nr:hypothetical protein [Pseudomonas mosselii]UPF01755.1 hypothetical protein MXB02_14220 [Pseudomonas mosselii]
MSQTDKTGLFEIEEDNGLDGDDPMALIIETMPPEEDEDDYEKDNREGWEHNIAKLNDL